MLSVAVTFMLCEHSRPRLDSSQSAHVFLYRFGIAGIGEAVKIDDSDVMRHSQEMANEVAADESTAPGDEYPNHGSFHLLP